MPPVLGAFNARASVLTRGRRTWWPCHLTAAISHLAIDALETGGACAGVISAVIQARALVLAWCRQAEVCTAVGVGLTKAASVASAAAARVRRGE
eukprot:COSAG05_NODE_5656_length_1121_cov_28.768852_1_plen_94_part_10